MLQFSWKNCPNLKTDNIVDYNKSKFKIAIAVNVNLEVPNED